MKLQWDTYFRTEGVSDRYVIQYGVLVVQCTVYLEYFVQFPYDIADEVCYFVCINGSES